MLSIDFTTNKINMSTFQHTRKNCSKNWLVAPFLINEVEKATSPNKMLQIYLAISIFFVFAAFIKICCVDIIDGAFMAI